MIHGMWYVGIGMMGIGMFLLVMELIIAYKWYKDENRTVEEFKKTRTYRILNWSGYIFIVMGNIVMWGSYLF